MLTAVEDRSGLPWWWSGSFNRKKSEKNQNDSSVLPKIPGAAGPVKVKWMAGHMKVKLVAGHMKVKLTADHLKVKLTAGHMQVKLIAGHVKVKLMAGHMKVNVKVNWHQCSLQQDFIPSLTVNAEAAMLMTVSCLTSLDQVFQTWHWYVCV